MVKRTPLSAYKNIRTGGLIAAGVADDDELCVVKLLNPDDEVDIMARRGAVEACLRVRPADPDAVEKCLL